MAMEIEEVIKSGKILEVIESSGSQTWPKTTWGAF